MKKIFVFLFVVVLLIPFAAKAVPAVPYPVDFKQPNGKIVTVLTIGDERFSYNKSLDGYTLIFDDKGFLTYAVKDDNGNLKSSGIVATQIEERDAVVESLLNEVGKNAFYSKEQFSVLTQVHDYKMSKLREFEAKSKSESKDGYDVPVVGSYKVVCALVQFPELSFVKTIDDFEGLMNQINYVNDDASGSVRDFFKESSYNKFDLEVTLVGPFTAPNSEAYYLGSNGKNEKCPELAQFALDQANLTVDFSEYDGNDDEIVDGFHIIFAGYGQEASGGAGYGLQIWSHKWAIQHVFDTGNYYEVDGKYIAYYSCSPELRGYSDQHITFIGVIAHEMSHAFGSPDYYDTDYEDHGEYMGTGKWDIMASGSWNDGGRTPAHHNMFQKIRYGWVEPIVLDSKTTVRDMPSSEDSPVAYRVNVNANEYFILDNRQQKKFDTAIPGHGLLIYRISGNNFDYDINITHKQGVYPVCASSNVAIPNSDPYSYGDINSAGCPFPGSSSNNQFTDETKPSMKSWAGKNTNKPITDIIEIGDKISFEFMNNSVESYVITIGQVVNGKLIVRNGNTTIKSGDKVSSGTILSLTVKPDEGYELEDIRVNGVLTEDREIVVETNIEILATFKPITCTITVISGDNGKVMVRSANKNSEDTNLFVVWGTRLSIEIIPDEGYELDELTINDVVITEREITANQRSMEIKATFKSLIGVEEIEKQLVRLYPNPVVDFLNIAGEFDMVDLYDLDGSCLIKSSNLKCIDFRGLNKGIYLLTVYKNGEKQLHKVMKQ